ncbi:MAG: glycyl-radical enzyme activating protein [Armatimonadetes bacterium]|nr:glycyl-radical enzyme activating protein [Armatimonadota bacterium]
MAGIISDIQRFAVHDGPGIRTTVFLKGCPMRCLWCHNPEARSNESQLAFYANKCIDCGLCAAACPNGAILSGDRRVDRERCCVCGACADACPSGALELIGRVATAAQVLDVVMRDLPYYKISDGGVTMSGGEPLYQHSFSIFLLRAFMERGLHTAVDTCGLAPWERLAEIAGLTNLFLYDIKAADPEKHARFCGTDNAIVLQNARRLAETGAKIIFRVPLIPGYNDSAEDIRLVGEFILSLPGDQRLEFVPYHRIGKGKYEALGLDYPLPHIGAPQNLDECKRALLSAGVKLVTG